MIGTREELIFAMREHGRALVMDVRVMYFQFVGFESLFDDLMMICLFFVSQECIFKNRRTSAEYHCPFWRLCDCSVQSKQLGNMFVNRYGQFIAWFVFYG